MAATRLTYRVAAVIVAGWVAVVAARLPADAGPAGSIRAAGIDGALVVCGPGQPPALPLAPCPESRNLPTPGR